PHHQHQAGTRGRVHAVDRDPRSLPPARHPGVVRRHARERDRSRAQRRTRFPAQLRAPGRPFPQRALLGAGYRYPGGDHGPGGEGTRAPPRAAWARSGPAPGRLERVAGTGVVARIPGRDGSRAPVAVRGDIDALPISESTGLPFASEHPGVMHACGHDVHATWAVGAAHLLAARPATGDVLIVLQPAEDTGRGANAVLESGALDGVAAIFGAHVDRRFAVGEVVAQEGPLAAAADTFEIELVGSGAHGARPHEAADPIVGAAALIGALQTILARRVNPAY